VYFNKSTGTLESRLEDLFKKPKSLEKRRLKRAPLSPSAPRPDVAQSSSSCIVTPAGDRGVTRVAGVVDLISSEENDTADPDESETDLDDLPKTEDFDYGCHRSSDGDGGRDGDEDSDTRSEPLF
jgi:hypothetical protein